jgi:hypothetical protein
MDIHGSRHEEFLELCAVAASGFLAAEKRQQLTEHLAECASCKEYYEEYQELCGDVAEFGASSFALGSEGDTAETLGISDRNRMWQRFAVACSDDAESNAGDHRAVPLKLARPRKAGTFADSMFGWLALFPARSAAAGLLLAAAIFSGGYRFGWQGSEHVLAPVQTVASAQDDSRQRLADALAELESQKRVNEEARTREVKLVARITEIEKLNGALRKDKEQLQVAIQQGATERQALDEKVATDEEASASLERETDSLRQQLESVRKQKDTDIIRSASLEAEALLLKNQVGEQERTIAQQRDWLDADRDIRDLMGARDLIITEVHDVAKNAKTQKPFARVFFTKGKSLVFYAYDLDGQAGLKDATFQAWGVRSSGEGHAVALGILYSDKDMRKRWVLKFDDPKTLQQIDAIFVTLEPRGGSTSPSGKQMLFAYLGAKSNHP